MTPTCPLCKEEIDHLEAAERTIAQWDVRVENNKLYFTEEQIIDGNGETEYMCPECGETLFDNEETAELFLKGELIL